LGLAASAAASMVALAGEAAQAAAPSDLNEATLAQLQAMMQSGGPFVNSVIELNPDARAIAPRSTLRAARPAPVGLVSRAGVVPISHTQDTLGPHARTVADAAVVLGAIQSRSSDPRDPATAGGPLGWAGTGRPRPTIPADSTQFLNPDGLRGKRLGVWQVPLAAATARVGNAEFLVLLDDFVLDLRAYLTARTGVPIHNLADAIASNTSHVDKEMPFPTRSSTCPRGWCWDCRSASPSWAPRSASRP